MGLTGQITGKTILCAVIPDNMKLPILEATAGTHRVMHMTRDRDSAVSFFFIIITPLFQHFNEILQKMQGRALAVCGDGGGGLTPLPLRRQSRRRGAGREKEGPVRPLKFLDPAVSAP